MISSRSQLRRSAFVTLGALLTVLAASCGSDSSAPATHARVLSISASPRQIPPPTTSDFVAAVDLIVGAGARGQFVSATWKDLEADSGALDVQSFADNVNYSASRVPTIMIGIQVINTVAKEVPADLANTPFDDPALIARFHALIDTLAASFPGKVTYLSIGNEVDGYLESTSQWDAYRRFYENALAYVHQKMPGVKVGVTAGYDGLTGATSAKVAALNTESDVVILTYYPLLGNGHVAPATSTRTGFPKILAAAANKPVVVQELGYPASTQLGSSDSAQAAFFTDAIDQWSRIDGARMLFVNLFLLHDFTDEQCDAFGVYYGLPADSDFKAFLCTLGLRHADGTARPSWQAVVDAARAAGLPSQ